MELSHSGQEMNDTSDEEDADSDDSGVAQDAVVYIVEGGQIGYGSKRAWDAARDC